MDPKLVEEMLKPRDEEIEELKRQVDALCEELENIATAEWRDFDPDVRRSPYEFVQWAQSRARHTLNRVLSGDVTKPLPEDVATGMRKLRQVGPCPCTCSDHGTDIPMKYRRMEHNAALQNENAALRDELDAWRERFSDDYEYRSGMGVVVMIEKT